MIQSKNFANSFLARVDASKGISCKTLNHWMRTGTWTLVWDEEEQVTRLFINPNGKRRGLEVGSFIADEKIIATPQHPDPRVQEILRKVTTFYMFYCIKTKVDCKKTAEFLGNTSIYNLYYDFQYQSFKV